MFNIKTPILFQATEVGQIILGLSQDGLDEVKSITGWLMFILALITTSSTAVVMFIFGGLIAHPLKVLNRSLNGFASGNLDTRISLTRNDEIGEVFDSFNNMAAAIQVRYTKVSDELAQSGINKTGITESPKNLETNIAISKAVPATTHELDQSIDATIISTSQIFDTNGTIGDNVKDTPAPPPIPDAPAAHAAPATPAAPVNPIAQFKKETRIDNSEARTQVMFRPRKKPKEAEDPEKVSKKDEVATNNKSDDSTKR